MDISRVHDRFCSVVSKIDKAITSIEKNVYTVLVLYFFGKSWKTIRSIHLLCTHRFAEDAGILARSLFDLVVTFLYIAKAPSERALRYVEYGIVLKEQLQETLTKELKIHGGREYWHRKVRKRGRRTEKNTSESECITPRNTNGPVPQ